MSPRIVGLVGIALLAMTLPASLASGADMVDLSKVPHYFGPWPNWANSPLTQADATVTIADPGGRGTGATATAAVGADGAITGITIDTAGANYDESTTITITGAGTGAYAQPIVTNSASVSSIAVATSGAGFGAPIVSITGGGGSGATASASGGVDAIELIDGGSGYQFPTVDFDWPSATDGVKAEAHVNWDTATGTILGIVIDNPGSGYVEAPNVVIHNGTALSPLVPDIGAPALVVATAIATINVTAIAMDTFGAGYTSIPTVSITDANGFGTGATAGATITSGGVTGVRLISGGSGYITPGGIRKFTDALPLICDPLTGGCPTEPGTKFIPLAVPDTTTGITQYHDASESYEIAVVQYRTSFSSSIKNGTIVRGYVQIETPQNASFSQHFPLTNELLDGTKVPILRADGSQYYGVTSPQYLGPIVSATKDVPVRVVFRNLLPTGQGGDLFLPVDTTMMGSGMGNMDEPYDPAVTTGGSATDAIRNPMCTADQNTMGDMCYAKNRATLHLHGGNTPWISDGTVHQWITPAGEKTAWPQGVGVRNVPDMNVCTAADDGCMTFYYTNQQSARLMWIHDHSYGITRLNVYAGEAMGYMITDDAEKKLIADGTVPSDQIPLIIQDKTFVPDAAQLATQDPTWDSTRWGAEGSLWYHHVYMPAQNPSAPNGMSSYGRWLYGPWFWPPAGDAKYGPILNPYFDPNCSLDNPSTWQYQQAPFCEPQLAPGTPNVSAGMEQFNDTPLVNGTAYPTLTVDPKSYRLRILNAANDRFFNLQWYVGEQSTASQALNQAGQPIGATEVALKASEVAAAQTDPIVYPTPDESLSPAGPDWIQIGTEGGFLPAPAIVSGHQPITWITDPTRFDFGNADKHSLLLGNAERADVIVDFSKYAGKTLILYNDAPAAFPARSPLYDYYTGDPDLTPGGAPTTLPGFGPNTRTVMQVKVAAATPAPAFNLAKLRFAFSHKANGSGVFESSQHPIVVGQAAYNSAYGTNFVKTGWCNSPSNPTQQCDGFARITEQGGMTTKFDTLSKNSDGTVKQIALPIQPKSMHDETNATSYDEFGRMQANLGVELYPATPGTGGAILYQFGNPPTEIFDGTGMPTADMNVQPISTTTDGTQIWKITHNGVDTHPIHFHAFDVQVINRVTWDNIVLAPDDNELGWKETVRISPLEDTYIAIRPVLPKLPWELPNSIRTIDPVRPDTATLISNTIATSVGITTSFMSPDGNPSDLFNHYINFGAEYLWHCHILSHEEMDMMRTISIAYPPVRPATIQAVTTTKTPQTVTLTWADSSIAETGYQVQRRVVGSSIWTTLTTVRRPINGTYVNKVETMTYTNTRVPLLQKYQYRVIALNTVGDTWNYAGAGNPAGTGAFPTVTAKSYSDISDVLVAPETLTVTSRAGLIAVLGWIDQSDNELGFQVERSANNGVTWTAIARVAPKPGSGLWVGYNDSKAGKAGTYLYRVAAIGSGGLSAYTNTVSVALK